mmetsp:Transcript_859/g.1922  ORF Transcript_859/g.1922 Transcript_859/m.1922 type:complete len:204 (+) Transcript_859:262-873(+)
MLVPLRLLEVAKQHLLGPGHPLSHLLRLHLLRLLGCDGRRGWALCGCSLLLLCLCLCLCRGWGGGGSCLCGCLEDHVSETGEPSLLSLDRAHFLCGLQPLHRHRLVLRVESEVGLFVKDVLYLLEYVLSQVSAFVHFANGRLATNPQPFVEAVHEPLVLVSVAKELLAHDLSQIVVIQHVRPDIQSFLFVVLVERHAPAVHET